MDGGRFMDFHFLGPISSSSQMKRSKKLLTEKKKTLNSQKKIKLLRFTTTSKAFHKKI